MIPEERRAILLQEIRKHGYLAVSTIANRLEVSSTTIRRDLEKLETAGKLTRIRGGAASKTLGTTHEPPYELKRHQATEQKRRIAQQAATLVEEGDSIILDGGSTTFELADHLQHFRDLTVVTNDLMIANRMAENPRITLICTGGVARPSFYYLLGPMVESFLHELRVDKTFLGADAIHEDGTIGNFNLDEVSIKQAMIEAASKSILLVDATKFYVTGFVKVCDLQDLDEIITDRGIPLEWFERHKTGRTKLTIV
jgi:DeoR family fructose operon transcriptional repressor